MAVLCTPAGVSGAFLLLPIQVQVLGVPSPAVSATNLLYNVVSAPAGVVTYQRSGRFDRKLALLLCAGTLPGVIAGVLVRSTWLSAGCCTHRALCSFPAGRSCDQFVVCVNSISVW